MLGSSDGLLEGAPPVKGDIGGKKERFWLTLGDLDGLDVGLPVLVGLRLGWLDGIPLTLGLSGGIDVGLLVLVGLILGCELSWETSRRWDSLSGRTRMVGTARQDSRSEAHWQHGNSTTCRQKGFNPTDSVQEDVRWSGCGRKPGRHPAAGRVQDGAQVQTRRGRLSCAAVYHNWVGLGVLQVRLDGGGGRPPAARRPLQCVSRTAQRSLEWCTVVSATRRPFHSGEMATRLVHPSPGTTESYSFAPAVLLPRCTCT